MKLLHVAELKSVLFRARFFILETTHTSDGLRTRVCDGRWETQEAAEQEVKDREQRMEAYRAGA